MRSPAQIDLTIVEFDNHATNAYETEIVPYSSCFVEDVAGRYRLCILKGS